jgi:UDP-N-acetylmuramoyl-L-alanyl-D-glutamate--2,6-diaminopimelate ligase
MLAPSQRLADLAAAVPGAVLVGNPDQPIGRIVLDSRLVGTGDLFVASPGLSVDRSAYVGDAFHAGAAAVAVERVDAIPAGCSGLVVPSARVALGLLAAAREGQPSRYLRVVGVTGTDGKTTTSSLIASILRAEGRTVGVVSTVFAEIGGKRIDTGFHTTTPDAPELQRYLAEMVRDGATDAVLEVTSHGLAQERVAGCDFDAGVITNVSGDHLDFHGTFERYLAAKLRLFEGLAATTAKPEQTKVAVFNLDDVSAEPIARLPIERKIAYALEQRADVRARAVRFAADATAFDAETPIGSIPVRLSFVGWYNVANALAAIATAIGLQVPAAAIAEGLAQAQPVCGRFERIDLGQRFEVVVDFAHTARSLEQVLTLARERCTRRVHVVFGGAGLRDREKRPRMGEVAGRLADAIYLTAEDPRTESLDSIIEEIAVGCRHAGRSEGIDYWRIPNRGEAIERAIQNATDGDLVLITGKGHERSMCFGTTERPWSDQDAARVALARCLEATRSN